MTETVIHDHRLHLVRSEIGSGISTAFEQIASLGGISEQAIDAALTRWTNEPLSDIVDGAIKRFRGDACARGRGQSEIAPLWLIHAFRPSQVTSLRNRLVRFSEEMADVSIVVRIEDNPSTRSTLDGLPTFLFARAEPADLARCVARSIRSAGATRTIFQEPAIEQMVRLSQNSYRELATATHRMLSWGHFHGLSEITSQAVRECFGTEIAGRKTGTRDVYRRAS